MGGLTPRTESAVLGGLPFTFAGFCDFRTHGPRMRIDELSAPSGGFVTRVSASVATVDHCPDRGRVSPAADNAFASVFAVPTEVGTCSAEAPATATTVAQPTPFSRRSTQGTDSVVTTGPTVSAPASPGCPAPQPAKPPSDRISTRTRRRTATAAGNAPPAVDYGFGPGGAPRPSARRGNTPSRVPRLRPAPSTATNLLQPPLLSPRYPFRPTATA